MNHLLDQIGVENFRDLGGIPTSDGRHIRSGLVYRSACPVAAPHDVLRKLGIHTIVDFRSQQEVTAVPHSFTEAKWIHLPVFAGSRPELLHELNEGHITPEGARELMVDIYSCQVTQSAQKFGHFLQLFAHAENLPLLFHCMAGKDRTGHAAMLLLWLLGVAWKDILANYLETNQRLQSSMREDVQRQLFPTASLEAVQAIMEANPIYLATARDEILASYGSIEPYLLGPCGLTEADIASIRRNLLD